MRRHQTKRLKRPTVHSARSDLPSRRLWRWKVPVAISLALLAALLLSVIASPQPVAGADGAHRHIPAAAPIASAAHSSDRARTGGGHYTRKASANAAAHRHRSGGARAAHLRAHNSALTLALLKAQLARAIARGGAASSALVYDLTAHRTLFARRPGQLHPPASVEKLYTSAAALELLGPSARLTTSVYGSGRLRGNTWEGNLYLRGGGDPTFGSRGFIASHYANKGASISTLIRQLVHGHGIRRITGRIEGDESRFDSLRGEPSSGYAWDPWLEGTLSALSFNRGYSGSMRGPHAPAAYSARRLLLGLKAAGVHTPGGSGAATTPPGAIELARVRSPKLSVLLAFMLPPSDNFFAETLLKDLGAAFGGVGTTAAGAQVVRQTVARLGIAPTIVDGSGLSRSDLTSPQQVVTLLSRLAGASDGTILRSDLAVAGRTGTLSERMRHSWAEGRCQAKTGTLTGASNLAGYCQSRNGHLIAFTIFDDRIATASAHVIQNAMTEAIADY